MPGWESTPLTLLQGSLLHMVRIYMYMYVYTHVSLAPSWHTMTNNVHVVVMCRCMYVHEREGGKEN